MSGKPSQREYAPLRPATSICLLNDVLFRDSEVAHHRFRLNDPEQGRELGDNVEVHTVELVKYDLLEATIGEASKIEQWASFCLFADQYDSERLRALLTGVEFEQAITAFNLNPQRPNVCCEGYAPTKTAKAMHR